MVLPAESPTLPAEIPATMRAAVLVGQGDIRVVEKPVPTPGRGRGAGQGRHVRHLRLRHQPSLPTALCPSSPPYGTFTPGHEWTGTVAALGPSVDELAVGDRVAHPRPQRLWPLRELRPRDVHRLPELREPGARATARPG